MEKIIEKLYEAHLNVEDFVFCAKNKEAQREEWELYCFFYETLAKEEGKVFAKYVDMREQRHREERQAAYETGFKTAIKMILESLK